MPLPLSWPDWSRLTPPMMEGRWQYLGSWWRLGFGLEMTKVVTGCILLQYVELDGHDPATLMGHGFLCSGFCSEGEHTLDRLSSRWSQAVVFSTGAGLQWLGLAPFSGSVVKVESQWSLCPPWMWQHLPSLCARSSSGVLALGKEEKQGCMLGHVIKRVSREGYLLPECVRRAWTLFRPKSSCFWHALWNFSLWNYGYR